MDGNEQQYLAVQAVNPIDTKEEITIERNALTFDLDDATFLEYAKKLKRDDETFWNEKGATGYNLADRRRKNELYYFGRQFSGVKFRKYNSRTQDNILWEAEAYLRAMALSKLPDITVKPGSDSEDKKKVAELLSRVVTSDLQSRERKRVLGLAFKHLPVYFTGVIKPFWNPQKGKDGDYDFKTVHPELLTVDFRAASNDPRSMDHIFETCENTVKELTMMFPESKQRLFDELRKRGILNDSDKTEKSEKGLNSKVKYQEVWFKWYEKTSEKDEYEEIVGVGWYYENCLLRKIKHPYWDWTGDKHTFTYKLTEVSENTFKREKVPPTEEMLRQLLGGQSIPDLKSETIFHNHLDYPEFPYIFLGMDQWGKTPLDETSRIEQSIPMQETYDFRNQQEDEIIARSRGKHVFSSSEGLTKDDVANMDMADPELDILIKGDVGKMHAFIPGEQPTPALIEDRNRVMERIFQKQGVNQATRGEINSDTAATNTQISREGDFTRMDDLVDDTINYAAEKMANWILQFIKLFYTTDHAKRILGEEGQWFIERIQRDMIEDGMEVTISASGSDKLKAEQRAMDMAKMKMIDPYRFYKDIGSSDPKGRTLALMQFLMNPQAYMTDVQNGGDGSGTTNPIKSASNVVNGQIVPDQNGQDPNQPQGGQSPQATQDIMMIEQGQVPQVPQSVDPAYAQTFNAFMQSPEVEQLIQRYGETFKQQLLGYAQAISQLSQQQPQPQAQGQGAQQFGQEAGAQVGVGPLAGNPNPSNTTRVAAVPH